MRKWGILISFFYALILLGLIVPTVILFSGRDFDNWTKFFGSVRGTYQDWLFWVPAGAILLSQIFLLFLLWWPKSEKDRKKFGIALAYLLLFVAVMPFVFHF
ncbi:MAG: hypothetical protein WBQ89_22355 [Candidatus Acidiferrum sp.]